MSDENKKMQKNMGPQPWGSEPIRGLNYDYLDISEPPKAAPKPVVPEVREYALSTEQAQDFYKRTRSKIVSWAQNAGAGKEVTKYILLVPDIMALFVRLMGDPRVSAALKAEIAAASAYIIIPVDLMPEAVMGPAGLIDDAIVGVIALNRVLKVMGQSGEEVLRENWDGDEDLLVVMRDLLEKADKFVSGRVWNGIKKFMADAAQDIKDVAKDVKQGTGRSTKKGPVIEGSFRPILPPGVTAQDDSDDDQQWIIPPNERG